MRIGLRREIPEGSEYRAVPFGWAIAWEELPLHPGPATVVLYPFGVHWIARAVRAMYYGLLRHVLFRHNAKRIFVDYRRYDSIRTQLMNAQYECARWQAAAEAWKRECAELRAENLTLKPLLLENSAREADVE